MSERAQAIKAARISRELERHGLPAEHVEGVLAAIEAAGLELVDRQTREPVLSVPAARGARFRIRGVVGAFGIAARLGDGWLVQLERRDAGGELERSSPTFVPGADLLATSDGFSEPAESSESQGLDSAAESGHDETGLKG